jgi:hypothetical protein
MHTLVLNFSKLNNFPRWPDYQPGGLSIFKHLIFKNNNLSELFFNILIYTNIIMGG